MDVEAVSSVGEVQDHDKPVETQDDGADSETGGDVVSAGPSTGSGPSTKVGVKSDIGSNVIDSN